MKKLFMAAAVATALSSSVALAETDKMFYLGVDAGAVIMTKSTDKLSKLKMKSSPNMFFGVGAGYYVMDNVRSTLTFAHYINPTTKKDSVKHKGSIDALMANVYADIFDISITKFFVGAGVGMARISEKISYNAATIAAYPGADAGASAKNKNNFAYALTAGVTAEVDTGINVDMTYSWKDFGKTKDQTNFKNDAAAGHQLAKTGYKGHHVGMGIRFDI